MNLIVSKILVNFMSFPVLLILWILCFSVKLQQIKRVPHSFKDITPFIPTTISKCKDHTRKSGGNDSS